MMDVQLSQQSWWDKSFLLQMLETREQCFHVAEKVGNLKLVSQLG